MENNEKVEETKSALVKMVEKLDNRPHGNGGYVTHTPEIIAILSELSKLVPAVVLEDNYTSNGDIVGVTIKIGFSLERSLL